MKNTPQNPANGFSVAEIRLDRDKKKQLRELQKQRRALDKRSDADRITAIDAEIRALLDDIRED